MSGKWIEVAAKDYVLDVSRSQDGSICLIQVMKTTAPFNIFGMPFFIDYTTVFDDDASEVSFEPTEGSSKINVEFDSKTPKNGL